LAEDREIFIPHLYLSPPQGGDPSEFREDVFDADKTRMIGLSYGEKNYDNILNRFHLIPERYGQTDGRTDGRTDSVAISISRVSVLARNKNYLILMKFCTQQQILNWMKLMNVTYVALVPKSCFGQTPSSTTHFLFVNQSVTRT